MEQRAREPRPEDDHPAALADVEIREASSCIDLRPGRPRVLGGSPDQSCGRGALLILGLGLATAYGGDREGLLEVRAGARKFLLVSQRRSHECQGHGGAPGFPDLADPDDRLRLLSFEVEAGRFGCYRLPVASERWLQRCAWMDEQGERWWPVFGAAYFVVAVKRVRGMRLVELAREQRQRAKAGAVVATHKRREREEEIA